MSKKKEEGKKPRKKEEDENVVIVVVIIVRVTSQTQWEEMAQLVATGISKSLPFFFFLSSSPAGALLLCWPVLIWFEKVLLLLRGVFLLHQTGLRTRWNGREREGGKVLLQELPYIPHYTRTLSMRITSYPFHLLYREKVNRDSFMPHTARAPPLLEDSGALNAALTD